MIATLTSTERHDTSPEIARVERHVNTRKRNRGESTVELDMAFPFLLFLSAVKARLYNVAQHFLNLLDGELLGQLQI